MQEVYGDDIKGSQSQYHDWTGSALTQTTDYEVMTCDWLQSPVLPQRLSGASPGFWRGLFSPKPRIFTVNFKGFFCVADFHGQFQRFFTKGTPWRRPCLSLTQHVRVHVALRKLSIHVTCNVTGNYRAEPTRAAIHVWKKIWAEKWRDLVWYWPKELNSYFTMKKNTKKIVTQQRTNVFNGSILVDLVNGPFNDWLAFVQSTCTTCRISSSGVNIKIGMLRSNDWWLSRLRSFNTFIETILSYDIHIYNLSFLIIRFRCNTECITSMKFRCFFHKISKCCIFWALSTYILYNTPHTFRHPLALHGRPTAYPSNWFLVW
jgi:hypothetical protein